MTETTAELPVAPPAIEEFPGGITEEQWKRLLQIQLADESHGVVGEARDHAIEQVNHAAGEGRNRVTRFVKRVWQGNIAKDYYIRREEQRGRQEIVESGNIHRLRNGDQQAHDNTAAAIITRVTEGFVRDGETQRDVAELTGGTQLKDEIKGLVRQYAEGTITDDDALTEAKTRLLNEFGKGLHAEDRNKGLMLADNILDVARNARAALAHGIGIGRIEAALGVKHADVKMGATTELRLNAAEKATNWLYQHKAGSLVNETTLAAAVSIPLIAGKFAARKVATTAGRFIGLGAGAAVVAGVRESYHIKQDRQIHMREMATGGGDAIAHAGKKREKMEATRYGTASAQDLLADLRIASESAGNGGADLTDAIDALTHVRTRMTLSDERKMDLIQYSDKLSVETERLDLNIRLAEARVAVQNALTNVDDATLAAHGITTRDIGALLDERSTAVIEHIDGDVTARDAVFRKLQRKEVLKAATAAFVTSEVIGLGIQEAKAAMDGSLQGVFEGDGDGQRRTLLAGIFRGNGHHAGELANQHTGTPTEIGQHSAVDVPKGYHLNQVDGKWELFSSSNKVVDGNVTFDPSGHLSDATKEALTQKGFAFTDAAHTVTDPNTITYADTHVSADEYINTHSKDFTTVSRELWYDNNTPNVYDKNELGLWWGGENGTGVDAQGNYVFSVADMSPDGSFHDGLSANAQSLIHEGKMAMALSVTDGTQQHVIMVHINEQGQAIINKDSFAGKTLFANQGGQAHYVGAYAEAVQLGDTHNGVQSMRMLATVVGDKNPHAIIDRIPTTVHHSHELITTTLTPPVEAAPLIEVPPAIPIVARRSLESPELDAIPRNPNISPFYYGGRSLQEVRDWLAADPSRLKTRREITNEDGTKSWLEADGEPVVRSVERERELIRAYLERQRAESPDHYAMVQRMAAAIKPMPKTTRVTVNVPAWMEESNLDHFLSEFTAQVDRDGNPLPPETYEINVLINRKTGTPADDSVGVIGRFVEKFEQEHGFKPNVNYYNIELDPPFNNVGYARKLLTDATVLRSVDRTQQDAALYIETEDADLMNVDRKTVINLINKLDASPQLDAVRGVQDRTPEYMMQNDLLFLRQRAGNFFEILARKKEYRDPTQPNWNFTWNRVVTGGWNTGYTAEAYALIDGYDSVEQGEDMSVGEKLTMIRGDGKLPNLEVIGTVASRTDSSPRRFIHEIATDKSPYADGNFADEEVNDSIRGNSLEDALAAIQRFSRITPENEAAFNGAIQYIALDAARMITPSPEEADHVARRILFWLGFKKEDYELNGDMLTIKSWDSVKHALDDYRERYRAKNYTPKHASSKIYSPKRIVPESYTPRHVLATA